MRVLSIVTGERWGHDGVSNEGGEMIWTKDEAAEDMKEEYKEEEEGYFDRYEPQSPETPASSPCPPSPMDTTPTLSRSSTSSDSSPEKLILSPPPYPVLDMIEPPSTGINSQFSGSTTDKDPFLAFEARQLRRTINGLPIEILTQIFRYSLDQNWIYDRLIEIDDPSIETKPQQEVTPFINVRHPEPVAGDDGNIGFCVVRIETLLSQVCKQWRNIIMGGLVNLWEPDENSNKKHLYTTGPQWFHPSFPSSILEGYNAYTHLTIRFSEFALPQEYFQAHSDDYDEPLFDAPEGANYFDSVAPRPRIMLDSPITIHLILTNRSSVALDRVLEHLHFPWHTELTILVDVHSQSRFYASTRYSPGVMGAGRYEPAYYYGDGGEKVAEPRAVLAFGIHSWTEGVEWEVAERVEEFYGWLGGARRVFLVVNGCPGRGGGGRDG